MRRSFDARWGLVEGPASVRCRYAGGDEDELESRVTDRGVCEESAFSRGELGEEIVEA